MVNRANSEEDSTAIFIELTVLSHVSMYCFCDHKKVIKLFGAQKTIYLGSSH